MLRLIFVILLIGAGSVVALYGPFHALLFYLWFAYFRPDDWSYGGTIASLRLSLVIGAYLLLRTVLIFPNLRLGLRTGMILLFLGQAIVATVYSEDPEVSQPFLIDFVKVMIITYLIVVLTTDRKRFRLVILVMAMSLGFETAKQGWVNLYRAPGAANTNPIAFLGDNNGVAVGTMMLLPILGALAQTSSGWWERFLHRFVAIGVFLRGISTYSRGGFLGAGALGAMTILRSRHRVRALIVVASLGFMVWQLMPARFWQRMDTITVEEEEERDSSSAGRLHFWTVGVEMARAKPLTGVGLNNFQFAYERYNTSSQFTGPRAAHSIWFGVLGDLGYVGLALFVLNLVVAGLSCWKVSRMARRDPSLAHLRIYADALISALTVYAVTGSFLSAHYSEMAWHFIGLSAALHFIAVAELAQLQEVPKAVAA